MRLAHRHDDSRLGRISMSRSPLSWQPSSTTSPTCRCPARAKARGPHVSDHGPNDLLHRLPTTHRLAKTRRPSLLRQKHCEALTLVPRPHNEKAETLQSLACGRCYPHPPTQQHTHTHGVIKAMSTAGAKDRDSHDAPPMRKHLPLRTSLPVSATCQQLSPPAGAEGAKEATS